MRTKIVVLTVSCGIVAGLVGATYALFHGYFDSGLFEIKETQWSPSGQVAMVAKRSDHQALNSDVYFVLVADHVFDTTELRHSYHSGRPDFAAANDCLRVSWSGPHNLVVTCRDTVVTAREIEHQRWKAGNIAIDYVNIPAVPAGSPISDKR
jgi:hypothetical protein